MLGLGVRVGFGILVGFGVALNAVTIGISVATAVVLTSVGAGLASETGVGLGAGEIVGSGLAVATALAAKAGALAVAAGFSDAPKNHHPAPPMSNSNAASNAIHFPLLLDFFTGGVDTGPCGSGCGDAGAETVSVSGNVELTAALT